MDWSLVEKIDLSKVFSQERSSFKKLRRTESQKDFLENTYKRCVKLDIGENLGKNSPALTFFKSMTRPDYDLLLNTVAGLRNHTIVNLYQNSTRLNIELIRFVKNNYRHANVVDDDNPYLKQALKLKLLTYCHIFEKLRKHTKRAIFFSDMQGPENFICQAFNIFKIPTATLQHGLYVEYFDENNINIINYKNHVANYFVAWGDCTANLIHKYRPDSKIIIAGKPTLSPIDSTMNAERDGTILIVSDQKLFDQQNLEMISTVLSAIPNDRKRIAIKLHPSNEKALYTKKFPKVKFIEQVPENTTLVVGHTTSLLYEMFSQGYNALKFRSEVESIHFPDWAQFDTPETFNECRKNLSSNKNISGSDYYIKHLGDESLSHYTNFLEYFGKL